MPKRSGPSNPEGDNVIEGPWRSPPKKRPLGRKAPPKRAKQPETAARRVDPTQAEIERLCAQHSDLIADSIRTGTPPGGTPRAQGPERPAPSPREQAPAPQRYYPPVPVEPRAPSVASYPPVTRGYSTSVALPPSPLPVQPYAPPPAPAEPPLITPTMRRIDIAPGILNAPGMENRRAVLFVEQRDLDNAQIERPSKRYQKPAPPDALTKEQYEDFRTRALPWAQGPNGPFMRSSPHWPSAFNEPPAPASQPVPSNFPRAPIPSMPGFNPNLLATLPPPSARNREASRPLDPQPQRYVPDPWKTGGSEDFDDSEVYDDGGESDFPPPYSPNPAQGGGGRGNGGSFTNWAARPEPTPPYVQAPQLIQRQQDQSKDFAYLVGQALPFVILALVFVAAILTSKGAWPLAWVAEGIAGALVIFLIVAFIVRFSESAEVVRTEPQGVSPYERNFREPNPFGDAAFGNEGRLAQTLAPKHSLLHPKFWV